MMPALRFENVMCRRDLSSMYLIWIFLRPLASITIAPDDGRAFLPPAGRERGGGKGGVSRCVTEEGAEGQRARTLVVVRPARAVVVAQARLKRERVEAGRAAILVVLVVLGLGRRPPPPARAMRRVRPLELEPADGRVREGLLVGRLGLCALALVARHAPEAGDRPLGVLLLLLRVRMVGRPAAAGGRGEAVPERGGHVGRRPVG